MKKILIDLNIILDFLSKRKFHTEAAHLIDLCITKTLTGYMCAHEVTTLSYFLLKEKGNSSKVINTIRDIMDIFTIIPINESILREALLSPIPDYEDAVIDVSARTLQLDCIITRNLSDFKLSRLPVYTPEAFLTF